MTHDNFQSTIISVLQTKAVRIIFFFMRSFLYFPWIKTEPLTVAIAKNSKSAAIPYKNIIPCLNPAYWSASGHDDYHSYFEITSRVSLNYIILIRESCGIIRYQIKKNLLELALLIQVDMNFFYSWVSNFESVW